MRGLRPSSSNISIFVLLTFCCFPQLSLAAGLSISPVADPINFGDVYAYEKNFLEQGRMLFTLTATGSGACSYSIRPDPGYTAPPGAQRIGNSDNTLSDGGSMNIWVWISCPQAGVHDFHILIASNCGDLRPTIRFTCIGYARIGGRVRDFFTQEPIHSASVEALSYYLTVGMGNDGYYSGVGRSGTQVVRVRADNYREQTVSVEITDAAPLSKDFAMIPIVSLGDAIGALQVSSGVELLTKPAYHVDMNGDGRIGLAETILLLQLVSGLR